MTSPGAPSTRVLGILNVTPDSFSDGGRVMRQGVVDVAGAVSLAEQILRDGADAIDLGGVSTRPGAPDVDEDEELRRVLPVVQALRGSPVWVDTSRARVAAAVLDAGALGINDQRAGDDPGMLSVVAAAGCPYVLMHHRGTPATMRSLAVYDDVVVDVWRELDAAADRAIDAGVKPSNLIFDPGIGFAKTADQSIRLLAVLAERPERPERPERTVLVGASRKSFLGAITGREAPGERLAASIAVALWARQANVAWVRVHDVGPTVDALRVWAALSC
ncbi:MAG: dihydropteroate synthase [Myxococcales bacterium]|nr:dihydropteroate synthase [Myxococcales bacterium]